MCKKSSDVCKASKTNPNYTGKCNIFKKCECKTGFSGENCDKTCANNCDSTKNPNYTGKCNVDGTCECKKGYSGSDCSYKCNCSNKGICSNSDINSCICDIGWTGDKCENPTKFNEFKIVKTKIPATSLQSSMGNGWENSVCDINNYYQVCQDHIYYYYYCSIPNSTDILNDVKNANQNYVSCTSR